VSEVVRATYIGQTFSISCSFDPPVEIANWPVQVGYSFSGNGSCGQSTATVRGKVSGTQHTTLDGTTVTAYVIEATVTTQGQIVSTSNETEWVDPVLRLIVHESNDMHGTFGAFTFSSNITRDLVSGNPS